MVYGFSLLKEHFMKKSLIVTLLSLLWGSLPLMASQIYWNGKVYDDATVAEMITVITTTNPVRSIPRSKHLYPAQKSLFLVPAFAFCKKIIVFDGIQPGFEDRVEDYERYKENIRALTKSDPYFSNTELIFCEKWVHLAGAVKEAMKRVTTPYVFLHQHDFVLQKPFDLNALIASMDRNPNIKHVKLANPRTNRHWHPSEIDEHVHGPTFVPLCRTFIWSDNDHVSPTSYYTDFVLPACAHGPMELFLNSMLVEARKKYGDICHPEFGTYVYGNMQDGGYLYHSHGAGD